MYAYFVVQVLLQRGVDDPNVVDKFGLPALWFAVEHGEPGCVRLLLAAGARAADWLFAVAAAQPGGEAADRGGAAGGGAAGGVGGAGAKARSPVGKGRARGASGTSLGLIGDAAAGAALKLPQMSCGRRARG